MAQSCRYRIAHDAGGVTHARDNEEICEGSRYLTNGLGW